MSAKQDLLEQVKESIGVQQERLEKLKETALDESHEAIDDIKDAISNLEPKLDQMKAKAWDIADAADDKWDDVKDSIEEGWVDAGNQIEDGWDKLTDSVKSMFS